MGLDVYVGPLTRYYRRDWETVIQQYGRTQGLPVKVIRANQDSPPPLPPQEVLELVTQWRAALSKALGTNLSAPLDWPESTDGEYFTDKPAWDGYASLVLLAAHDEHPEMGKPTTACSKWDEDPAWKASTADDFRSRYSTILLPELWLPCPFTFVFRGQDLSGNEVWIGSSITLLQQLKELNNRTANGTEEQLKKWRFENFEPNDPFDKAANFGLAIFLELAQQSVLLKSPMKLDY